MAETPPGAVQSSYLGGKIQLWQPAKGYRAAIDPALLAASLCLKPGARAVEFGCGPGAALFSAAHLHPDAVFLGIEQDQSAAQLAELNLKSGDFFGRVAVVFGDIHLWNGDARGALGADSGAASQIDAIFFNPPFFDDASTLRAPADAKAAAWINTSSLADWIALALKRVKEGGSVTVIQRADRLGDILAAFAPKAGGIRILPVHPHEDAPAKRVIVSAIKTSKAPTQILPGLVLHERGGGYTPQVDAILRGEGRTALASGPR